MVENGVLVWLSPQRSVVRRVCLVGTLNELLESRTLTRRVGSC